MPATDAASIRFDFCVNLGHKFHVEQETFRCFYWQLSHRVIFISVQALPDT